jgi:hypothetical protein
MILLQEINHKINTLTNILFRQLLLIFLYQHLLLKLVFS